MKQLVGTTRLQALENQREESLRERAVVVIQRRYRVHRIQRHWKFVVKHLLVSTSRDFGGNANNNLPKNRHPCLMFRKDITAMKLQICGTMFEFGRTSKKN